MPTQSGAAPTGGTWLCMKLIPAVRGCCLPIVFVHNFRNRKPNHKAYQQKLNPKCIGYI